MTHCAGLCPRRLAVCRAEETRPYVVLRRARVERTRATMVLFGVASLFGALANSAPSVLRRSSCRLLLRDVVEDADV